MTPHVVHIVSFKNSAWNITEETPEILSFELNTLPDEFLTFQNCCYEGLTTNIPQESYAELLDLLDKNSKVNLDEFLGKYTTLCLVVNDTVLSMDMLCNSSCYNKHPAKELGDAFFVRDKLDRVFPDKKLKYLHVSTDWYKKREEYEKKHIEQTQQIHVQLELMRLLNNKK